MVEFSNIKVDAARIFCSQCMFEGIWRHNDTHNINYYLDVSFNDRRQQFPSTPSPTHANHPQNLQESKTSHRRRNRVGFVLDAKDNQRWYYDYDIWK